jgi:hypothetical protein
MYMYMKAKVALETAYNWMFPLESEAYVERLDANMYKVTISFPDRDVIIQFKRPRGPLEDPPENVREELFPYLQNDRRTPIKIINVLNGRFKKK